MTIPSNRLVVVSALLLPVALFAGLSTVGQITAITLYGLLGLTALWDWSDVRSPTRALSAAAPKVVRLTRHVPGHIELHITHAAKTPCDIRVAMALPQSFESDQALGSLHLPRQVDTVPLEWPCTAHERGLFALTHCVIERPSCLGLWLRRQTVPLDAEIRVVPNLTQDRAFLATGFMHHSRTGQHQHRLLGKGREFEKLRDYMPGDCFGDIHWKATAKRQMPMTKEFQMERTQEVYVVMDASRLSAQAITPEQSTPEAIEDTMLERFITAATLFGQVSLRQGDHFGLITFSDQVHHFFPAGTGKAHHLACRNAMLQLKPHLVMPDYAEVFSWIRTRVRKRALLIVLTDLRDPVQAEEFQKGITMIAHQHLVLVTMLQPLDLHPVFDRPVQNVSDISAHLSAHLQWHAMMQQKVALHKRGIAFHLIPSERLAVHMVHEYMVVKKRQIL